MKPLLRRCIEFSILACLILLAIFLYVHIDKEVSKKLIPLKIEMISFMEKQIGRKIRYESISPSVFMYLEIRNLVVFSSVNYEREIFRIKNLKIKYNIITLLFESDPLLSVSEISISNTFFKFSLVPETDTEVNEFQQTFVKRLVSTTYRFRITGNNIGITAYTDAMSLNCTNLFFDLTSSEGAYEINVRKGAARAVFSDSDAGQDLWFFSKFRIQGTLYSGFDRAELVVLFNRLSSNHFVLEKQTFQVIFRDNKLAITKIQDKAPIDIQCTLDLNEKKLDLGFKTEYFKPAGMFKFTGPLASYNSWFDSLITSTGRFSYVLADGKLDYDLKASALPYHPILPRGIVVSLDMAGDNHVANFKPLVIRSKFGTINFTGNILFKNFFPQGFLRIVNIKTVSDKDINADFTIDRDNESLSLKSSWFAVGTSGFDRFDIDVYPKNNSLLFNMAASFAQGGLHNLVTAKGQLLLSPTMAFDATGNCMEIPASHLYRLFTQDTAFSGNAFAFLKKLQIQSGFRFFSDFRTIDFSTTDCLIVEEGKKENHARLDFIAREKEIKLQNIRAVWEQFDIDGDFNLLFTGNSYLSFAAQFNLEGIPYRLNGNYNAKDTFYVEGDYGLSASIRVNPDNTVAAAKATRFPFPLSRDRKKLIKETASMGPAGNPDSGYSVVPDAVTGCASFDINGIFPSDGDWLVTSPGTTFYDLQVFPIKKNELKAVFALDRKRLLLSDISIKDSCSEISGSGEAVFGDRENLTITGAAALADKNKIEKYTLTGFFDAYKTDARITFQNSPIERFGKFIISGSLSGDITVSGPFSGPALQGKISLANGTLNGDTISLKTEFRLEDTEIGFQNISCTFLDLKITNGQGAFNRKDGLFRFDSGFTAVYFKKNILCNLLFSGSLFNTNADESFDAVFKKEFDAVFRVSEIIVDKNKYDPWSLSFNKKGNTLRIQGGPSDGYRGTIMDNGDFSMQLFPPLPVQGLVKGNLTGKTLNSVVDNIRIDMNIFNVILGEKIVRFNQGFASGENIKISGLINDPDFQGVLKADNVTISFFLCPFKSELFQCDLTFAGKKLEMEKIPVRAGNGIIYAEKGIFYIDHWLPNSYDLAFSTDPGIGLYCVYDFESVKVDGYAHGTVTAKGDPDTIRIDGKLVADFCSITLSKPAEKAKDEDQDKIHLKLDLALESGRKVEFNWPTVNFPVLRCYAEKGSKLKISYDSMSDKFNMDGSIAIKGGEVFYFDRNFYLKSGNIVFNVDNPAAFDPTISVRAELRETDENNEEIKIFLVAENNKLSNFSPHFESDPVKTEHEIYILLGKTFQDQIAESGFGMSLLLLSSEVLSEVSVYRTLENTIRDIFNLDLFSIRTHIIENIIVDKIIGEEGDVGANTPDSLGKYLDNTTIIIGQYIGDDLFVSGLVRLREVDYYSPGSLFGSGFFGLEPELEFSLEWPTPFFNFIWTFNPTQENLDNFFLYLPDNTITFEWSLKY